MKFQSVFNSDDVYQVSIVDAKLFRSIEYKDEKSITIFGRKFIIRDAGFYHKHTGEFFTKHDLEEMQFIVGNIESYYQYPMSPVGVYVAPMVVLYRKNANPIEFYFKSFRDCQDYAIKFIRQSGLKLNVQIEGEFINGDTKINRSCKID